jgi:hypothetical protein
MNVLLIEIFYFVVAGERKQAEKCRKKYLQSKKSELEEATWK